VLRAAPLVTESRLRHLLLTLSSNHSDMVAATVLETIHGVHSTHSPETKRCERAAERRTQYAVRSISLRSHHTFVDVAHAIVVEFQQIKVASKVPHHLALRRGFEASA
jgi:hypothetical protein